MESIRIDRKKGLATVTIDDGAGNRFGAELAEGLRVAALQLQDAPPDVVIVAGGTDFSLGLAPSSDPLFEPFQALVAQRDAFRASELVQRLRNCVEGFARLPCPLLCAVEGRCEGPLLAVALSADLRVASLDATFRPTPVARGVVPGLGELTWLSQRTGADRTRSTLFSDGFWDAPEALQAGLVTELVPSGGALQRAAELANALQELPDAARVQTLITLRALDGDPSAATEAEIQAAARTWIRGEWRG